MKTNLVQDFYFTTNRIWERALRKGYSHRQILEERTSLILENDAYKSLPQYSQRQLRGYWDAHEYINKENNLVWCLRVPGEDRYMEASKLLKIFPAHKLDKEPAGYFWRGKNGELGNQYC